MPNRIEEHFVGIGPVSPEMLEERAREIAIINGRFPDDYTQDDWEQARRELSNPSPPSGEAEAIQWKNKTPTRSETPTKPLSEELVNEGVEEAEHDQLLEAHREDLRKQSEGATTAEAEGPPEKE